MALGLLVGVGVLISSGDTSSTTRNAALVAGTPCTKVGQVTKVSKQSVVCAKTNTGSLWYSTMKAKGKVQPCTKSGAIRKKSKIVWVCGVIKKKKLWQATQPLPPAVVASTTVIEPGASQPTPALDSTQVATPDAPVVADNTVLADTKIPDDKIVTQAIDDATTPTTPTTPTPSNSASSTAIPCAAGGTCKLRDIGPGGGIVFYVAPMPFTCGEDLKVKCTYLEAAIQDGTGSSTWKTSTRAAWGCDRNFPVRGTGIEIGTGQANTAKILSVCKTAGIAADVAYKYSTTTTPNVPGAAGQWFLPSRKELDALCFEFFKGNPEEGTSQDSCRGNYPNQQAVTGETNGTQWSFDPVYYWSSSETGSLTAWFQNFDFADQDTGDKGVQMYTRPVRAF